MIGIDHAGNDEQPDIRPKERILPFSDVQTRLSKARSVRAYFITVEGHFGLGPPDMIQGDRYG